MVNKRKLGTFEEGQGDVVAKPAVGTKTYTSGVAVREGLSSGSRQAFVALHQQILTPYSTLPLPITHPTVVILQHYHAASPAFDEIFNCWRESDKSRNERNAEAAVALLVQVIQILTPIPFFRAAVLGVVGKLVAQNEPYSDMMNRLVQSGKRDHVLLGLQLAGAAVQTDLPDASAGPSGSAGRLAAKVWQTLVEGGSIKVMGKLLGMRRRTKEGTVEYNPLKDPLDKPDIRHAALHLLLPLLSLPSLHAHSRTILPVLYNGLSGDPPMTIFRVLTGLWNAMNGPSAGLSRKTAIALIDENAIERMLELVNRAHVDPTTEKTVGEMVLAFLEVTTTMPGQGICFPDAGWYPRSGGREEVDEDDTKGPSTARDWREGRMRKGLHNRILSNVVRKLGAKVVGDHGRIGDWVIKVLRACPEIVAGYWAHSALSLDPKLNPRWLATISYVGRITSLPPPPMSTFYEPLPKGAKGLDYTAMPPRSHPPTVAAMIESILPAPLTKAHLSKGLLHADHLVQHVTALALARGLQKLDVVHGILRKIEEEIDREPGTSSENPWMKRRLELEMECRRRVPEVHVIIAFAQKSATLARVPADSDDEPESKLVAQSAMLTEVALRLFGLYHKTLPSISREAKFDIGKLLVSASSAKAERREKREAREGSVISDSGSVGSVGTLGTVGMGGGFGQGRGDVDGFEAMSQVHVLSLLTEVKDWQWTNKASGSQYSYLYHILVLHLSTPHPITHQMTSSLLDRLLLGSIMFDHDHGELEIWLQALPSLAGVSDISQRAFLIAQQIHLLSFLDDCVRRCMKTPYRYIEDTLTLLPDYFEPLTKPYQLISPLMMVMFEQLRAKIFGELIATEAAGVVLGYLRRVIIGLAGKTEDGKWLGALVAKLHGVILEARGKGQERKGLLGSVQVIELDLDRVFGGEAITPSEEPAVEMIDQEYHARTSIESALLSETMVPAEIIGALAKRPTAALARYGQLSAHLFASTSRAEYIDIITPCLSLSQGPLAKRLRHIVFTSSAIKAALLPGSRVEPQAIDALVQTLLPGTDDLLAGDYLHDFLESMEKDKKGKKLPEVLSTLYPWTRFFGPVEAQQAVSLVAKHAKRISEASDRVRKTISALITASADPAFALGHLGVFVQIKLLEPFVALLQHTTAKKGASDIAAKIDMDSIERILQTKSADGYGLVKTLVDITPSAAASFAEVLRKDPSWLKKAELLDTIGGLLVLPGLISPEQGALIVQTAIEAVKHAPNVPASQSARKALRGLVDLVPDVTSNALLDVSLARFNASFARLAKELADVEAAGTCVQGLVRVGLLYMTRLASSGDTFDDNHLGIFADLKVANGTCKRLELDADVVEPVIMAVVQDRLSVPEAVSFCALLVERSMLKASFIRQHLSLLYSSPTYVTLTSPSALLGNPVRAAFIELLSALFIANPYISCQPAFVEQILPLYRGSLAVSDQRLLGMFHTFESYRHISVSSVLSAWSAGAGRSSRAFEAITSLEPGKMFATAVTFPLKRALRGSCEVNENEAGQGLYDPAFILALFGAMLAENLTGLDWVEVLRSNVLGVAIAALSSRDAEMRSMAGWTLSKAMANIESVAFQEKPQLVYTLRLVRHAIPAPTESAVQPRLPILITSFLAHTLRALASPSNPLYPSSSRFLLQRPRFDAGDVPMLFGMLYASGEGHRRDRSWMVRFIKDSTRSEADWRLLKRRKTVELMQTLFSSSLDIGLRRLILQAMERTTRIPAAVMSLVHRNYFVTWLDSMWMMSETSPNRAVDEERDMYMAMLENIVIVLSSRRRDKDETAGAVGVVKSNKQWETKGREWIGSVEELMAKGLVNADAQRLLLLVRITQRFASMPFIPPVARLIPKLVDRLRALYPEPNGDAVYCEIVERLFDCTLALPCAGEDKLKDDVEEIGWRAGLLNSEVGEWVRSERRLAAWEQMRSGRA